MTTWLCTPDGAALALNYERHRQHLFGKHAAMTDQQPVNIERLRSELLDRVEAEPWDDWSPDLLRALIAVFDLSGITPVSRQGFRPRVVK
jgi:hypothetical protein